ncbi:MAG: YifB family Mg chelatase-like AAA ATPase [Kiritimatiellota bacterium]|nr:YifB family Mg chelatase-like AAA ATPase [Kiritimatiellota bacterium]
MKYDLDFSEVKGQWQAKRALEVAAAGGHNVLMIGPPGSGKTMLANRLPTILSNLSREEALETTKIYSVCGLLHNKRYLVRHRPFRSPHHTISCAGLVGGGPYPRPGEISLSHNGVLFIDEFTELRRDALESLRQPLEDGIITISRAQTALTYPARFMLVAAMNPCPCGWLGHGNGKCRCTPDQVVRYRGKLSGPLLDRIDLMIEVPAVTEAELTGRAAGESSVTVRERVAAARALQITRQGKPNAALTPEEIEQHCLPDCTGAALLKQALTRLDLSARAYHRILKVARSIADLAGEYIIRGPHVAEAIQYRRGLGG